METIDAARVSSTNKDVKIISVLESNKYLKLGNDNKDI